MLYSLYTLLFVDSLIVLFLALSVIVLSIICFKYLFNNEENKNIEKDFDKKSISNTSKKNLPINIDILNTSNGIIGKTRRINIDNSFINIIDMGNGEVIITKEDFNYEPEQKTIEMTNKLFNPLQEKEIFSDEDNFEPANTLSAEEQKLTEETLNGGEEDTQEEYSYDMLNTVQQGLHDILVRDAEEIKEDHEVFIETSSEEPGQLF